MEKSEKSFNMVKHGSIRDVRGDIDFRRNFESMLLGLSRKRKPVEPQQKIVYLVLDEEGPEVDRAEGTSPLPQYRKKVNTFRYLHNLYRRIYGERFSVDRCFLRVKREEDYLEPEGTFVGRMQRGYVRDIEYELSVTIPFDDDND